MVSINLDQLSRCDTQGHSSKGNQLKWKENDYWYKADHMGYEGLSEAVISSLLQHSSMTDYVVYEPARIEYRGKIYNGCRSRNFLRGGEELITADHLFRQYTGKNLTSALAQIISVKERIAYFVRNIQEFTGINNFGQYITTILEMDAFFLNEDRHTNNIALIYNPETKTYRSSPHFDNGLALLADTSNDFLLDKPIQECLKMIQAKPFSTDFEEQAEAAVSLYGYQLKFNFTINDVLYELDKFRDIYDKRILERTEILLRDQMRKYQYLFKVI